MPIPRFQCQECGKEFAKIIVNPNNRPQACPACGAGALREMGPAFPETDRRFADALCASCESCATESGSCGCGDTPC